MTFFPFRRYHHFDRFFDDQFDFFDPWYDFYMFPSLLPSTRRFRWKNQLPRLTYSSTDTASSFKSLGPASRPAIPENFRTQFDGAGFNPEAIKTNAEGRNMIVETKQEDRDYSLREMRRTYGHADPNQLTSYVTPNRNPETERRLARTRNDNQSLTQFGQDRDPLFDYDGFPSGSDFQPRIVDKGNNQKKIEMNVEMKNYRPDEIKVSVENNELIVQGEHQYKDGNRSERSSFFKSTTLPPGIQVDQLESRLNDDGQLKIEAPFVNK